MKWIEMIYRFWCRHRHRWSMPVHGKHMCLECGREYACIIR